MATVLVDVFVLRPITAQAQTSSVRVSRVEMNVSAKDATAGGTIVGFSCAVAPSGSQVCFLASR